MKGLENWSWMMHPLYREWCYVAVVRGSWYDGRMTQIYVGYVN